MTVKNHDGSSFELAFRLTFNFNAMALVEEHTGLSMFDGSVFKKPSATTLSVMLWAGIQENHSEYEGIEGLKAIRSYLSLENVKVAQNAINEAFLASLPEAQAAAIRKAAEEAAKNAEEGVEEAPLAQAPQTSA